jgi:hypothetical protein
LLLVTVVAVACVLLTEMVCPAPPDACTPSEGAYEPVIVWPPLAVGV